MAAIVPLDGGDADLSRVHLAEGTWTLHTAGRTVTAVDTLDGLTRYASRPSRRVMTAFRDASGGLRLSVRAVRPERARELHRATAAES